MAERITKGEIKEAFDSKDFKKAFVLLDLYLEQNPEIEQQMVENAVSAFSNELVNYDEVYIGNSKRFYVMRERRPKAY